MNDIEFRYLATPEFAAEMDAADPLRRFRERFHFPKDVRGDDVAYFTGNSLGLQPKSVRAYVEQELLDWELMGVEGHNHAKHPWLPYHEFLTEQTAALVGAKTVNGPAPDSVPCKLAAITASTKILKSDMPAAVSTMFLFAGKMTLSMT